MDINNNLEVGVNLKNTKRGVGISYKEKISYGLGDLACNLMFGLLSSYLMFFYTDIAGVGIAAVGVIMLVARIVDAVTDPLMGIIIDKTNTKWGKARPYVLFSAIPFAIVSVLTFYQPNLSQNGKNIYALITYILFCVMYTAVNIPYTTMMANLTDDQDERLSFNLFKSLGSNIGAFIATAFTLKLVLAFGRGNQSIGFTYTIAMYAVISIVLLFICFKNTKERISPMVDKISLRDSIRVIFSNKSWMLLCVIQFLVFSAMFIKNQSTVYYLKYYIGNENLSSILLSLTSILAIPIALVFPKIAKTIGKRNCIIIGQVLQIIGTLAVYFIKDNINLLIAFSAIAAVGLGLTTAVGFVMSAETVDYSEWKTGMRPEGIQMALIGFMVKLGMAFAGIVSAFVLNLGGYIAGAEQTVSSLAAITTNYIWIPMAIYVLIIVIALFYDLDKGYSKIIRELQSRRQSINE